MIFSCHLAIAQPFWTESTTSEYLFRNIPLFFESEYWLRFDGAVTALQPNLRKTADGGNTWIAIRFFDNPAIHLNQLFFTDLAKGYAATAGGVFETSDSGISWKRISPDNNSYNSIYAYKNMVLAFASVPTGQFSQNWGPLIRSSDNGNTWDTIIPRTTYTWTNSNFITMKPYVFGNKDGTIFAENIRNQQTMELTYSTDNGTSWSSSAMDQSNQTYTMGLISLPHCNDLLRTYISFKQNPQSDLYVSLTPLILEQPGQTFINRLRLVRG